jgi:hypothetical protein
LLDRAGADNRLALVVLGANWCHDSRALASRLHRPPLTELVQQHYELVFVDAGFLDKARAVMQQFGVALYYATPTVLIIDPASGLSLSAKEWIEDGELIDYADFAYCSMSSLLSSNASSRTYHDLT